MGGPQLVGPRSAAPTVSAHDLSANRLLAALPAGDWERWRAQLEWTELPLGQVLYESGSVPNHAVFPATAIVALFYVTENGASAEIAMVGNEGMVGIAVFMGGGSTPGRAVVQSAGHGFRMKAQAFKVEFERSPEVMRLFAALHAGADQPDGTDRRVPPAPLGGPATVSLAAAQPGLPARQ
jgi:hypothetical protein